MCNNFCKVAAFLEKKGRNLLLSSCFLCGTSLSLSEPLRFEEALPLVLEQAQLNKRTEASAHASRARVQAAKALPKPSGFVQHELLDGSAGDISETNFGISSPLDFLWKRSARVDSAWQFNEIASHKIAERKRQVAYQLASIYLAANVAKHQLAVFTDIETRLNEAYRISGALAENGEISPSQSRRIALAMDQLAIERGLLEAESVGNQAEFAALTDNETAQPKRMEISELPFGSLASAVTASATRPDLKAFETIANWRRAEIARYHAEGLPAASLAIAYRRDNENRRGAFIGFSVELPIFGETRANKRLARSESFEAEIDCDQLSRQIHRDIAVAFYRYQKLNKQVAGNNQANNKNHLASKLAAFRNGEVSVVEYLDAIQVYSETLFSQIERHRLRQQAALDLVFQTGSNYPFSDSTLNFSEQ